MQCSWVERTSYVDVDVSVCVCSYGIRRECGCRLCGRGVWVCVVSLCEGYIHMLVCGGVVHSGQCVCV